MDNSLRYQDIIKSIVLKYSQFRPFHGNIRLDPLIDEYNKRFSIMQVGWDRGRRVRGNILYIVINNDKVIVEYDGLEHGIINDLIRAGIPENEIILAYLPEADSYQHESRE
jgi:hypothetical protein